jgi:hypothetical protein
LIFDFMLRQHSLRIRHHAAEQFKRLHRLKHRHVAAIQRAAPRRAGVAQQFGFQREVHDLRDPQLRAQQLTGTGMPGSLAMPMGVVFTTIGLASVLARSSPPPRDRCRNAG